MSTPRFVEIRCPVCSHKLCEAFGISVHLVIRVKCTCKRTIQITEGFMTSIVREHPPQPVDV